MVFIGFLLAGSGTAIYFMRVRSDELKGKYPPTTCKTSYSNRLGPANSLKTGSALKSSLENWEHQAVNEYSLNMDLGKAGKPTEYGTTMQCFCRYQ